MKPDWRDEVKNRAANACAVLQEHHGLGYVQGDLHQKCAKIWAFYSLSRGVAAGRALAEFAYARALDTLPIGELAPSFNAQQLQQFGATGSVVEVVERFMSTVGDPTALRRIAPEAAAVSQLLRMHSGGTADAAEQHRLRNAADLWDRSAAVIGELQAILQELPVTGALLPPERAQLAPIPLLGLSTHARARALNADLARLDKAGVAEGQLTQVWYGTDSQQNRKRLNQRLSDIAAPSDEN